MARSRSGSRSSTAPKSRKRSAHQIGGGADPPQDPATDAAPVPRQAEFPWTSSTEDPTAPPPAQADDARTTETRLHAEQERFRLIIRATRDAVYDWAIGGGTAWCNDNFRELIGHPTVPPYQWWVGSLHPEDRDRVTESFHAAVGGKADCWDAEYRIRRADGSYVHVLDRASILRDATGRPVRSVGAMTDISARKNVEEALRESEERFRLAFEEGPIGMSFIRVDGLILSVNRCFSRMLGYTQEELLGKSVYEITHPDDVRDDAELTRQTVAGELPGYTLDKRYLDKNGQAVWARLTATTVRDRQGTVLYFVGIIEDIMERKQVEEALRRAERLAAIGTLSAGLAHEINNPLGAIVLSADAALLATDSPDRSEILTASLNNIQKAALRCGRIVKSILQFARDEVSHKWPCDLVDVALHARDVTRKAAAEAGVTVRLEVRDELPQLVVNPTEIEQVLVNLISNAIQASAPQSEVVVRLESWQDFVRLVVQDRGRGMSAGELRHIFDPFFTTRQTEGGTGLGLSITYGIIAQHGGTIEVKSQPDRGTIAEIILPVSSELRQGAPSEGQYPDH